MKPKGENMEKYIPSQSKGDYLSAVREFTQMTIKNPSFFNKTPEEQKDIALATIQAHKEGYKIEKE